MRGAPRRQELRRGERGEYVGIGVGGGWAVSAARFYAHAQYMPSEQAFNLSWDCLKLDGKFAWHYGSNTIIGGVDGGVDGEEEPPLTFAEYDDLRRALERAPAQYANIFLLTPLSPAFPSAHRVVGLRLTNLSYTHADLEADLATIVADCHAAGFKHCHVTVGADNTKAHAGEMVRLMLCAAAPHTGGTHGRATVPCATAGSPPPHPDWTAGRTRRRWPASPALGWARHSPRASGRSSRWPRTVGEAAAARRSR